MATTPGYTFAPTFENAEMGRRGGSPGEFPQGSIQVLNFRLPRVAGAPGPNSVSPLVGDRPTGGFGSAVLQSVLQTVLGPDQAAALTAAPAAASRSPLSAQAADPGSAILTQLLRGSSSAAPSTQGPDFSAPAPVITGPPPSRAPDPVVTVEQPPGTTVTPPATVNPEPTDSGVRGPNFSHDATLDALYGRKAVRFG